MDYINQPKENCCAFCRSLEFLDGPENLVLWRGKLAFVILNRYPYTSGHVMVVPYQHACQLTEIDSAARTEIMELAAFMTRVIQVSYKPQGFNVGFNIGEAAGAGIAGHIHMHIVPRWNGDTNFMSSVGLTRILPEGLEDTYQRLKAAWQALSSGQE
jgi:ATP adenylyltransferase